MHFSLLFPLYILVKDRTRSLALSFWACVPLLLHFSSFPISNDRPVFNLPLPSPRNPRLHNAQSFLWRTHVNRKLAICKLCRLDLCLGGVGLSTLLCVMMPARHTTTIAATAYLIALIVPAVLDNHAWWASNDAYTVLVPRRNGHILSISPLN
jgi:hypothetical protein